MFSFLFFHFFLLANQNSKTSKENDTKGYLVVVA